MTITTRLRLVSLDDTHNWDDSVIAQAGRIYGVYLFDANRPINCCEITPSYELHFVGDYLLVDLDHVFGSGESSALEDLVRDQASIDAIYVHCRNIDRLSADHFYDFPEGSFDTEDERVEDFASTLEQVRGNEMISVPGDVTYLYSAIHEMLPVALQGYLATALMSSMNSLEDIVNGSPETLGNQFDIEEIAPATRESANEDVKAMLIKAAALFAAYPAARDIWDADLLGCDFWLNRNRHGSGFWDRVSGGHPAHAFGDLMSKYSIEAGTVDLYVGDDKLIYAE